MKVLLVAASFMPSYGGPAFSVSRLARALADAGIEVGLWAPDGSAADTPLLPPGPSVRRLTGTEGEALDRFGGADLIHDNGIWRPHNHRLARLAAHRGVPRIVSPRGMVEPWAMNEKRLKKALAWGLYQRRDLRAAQRHHATAEAEAASLRRLALGVDICVIPNGVDVEAELSRSAAAPTPKTALFMSRIHPKKGLPMLVEAWARIRPEGWRLRIAGPDEAGHRGHVEKAVEAAGLGGVVSFLGVLDGPEKRAALRDAALFVLPTHSENFGMVVAEALAHGLPVLTTTGAPWPMLVERNCGWWVEPTVQGLAEGLRQATAQDAGMLRSMGARGRALVAESYGWSRVAEAFVAVYDDVLRGVRTPAGAASTRARTVTGVGAG